MTGAPPGVPNDGSVEVVDCGTDGALDDLPPAPPAVWLPVAPAWVVVPVCPPATRPGLEPFELSETTRATAAMTTRKAATPTATASQRSGGPVEIPRLRDPISASNDAEARGSVASR